MGDWGEGLDAIHEQNARAVAVEAAGADWPIQVMRWAWQRGGLYSSSTGWLAGCRRFELRQYQCTCGNALFFENALCLQCGRDVGYCQACRLIAPLDQIGGGKFRCGNPACGCFVVKCENYAKYNVCNRCVPSDSSQIGDVFCDCCRCNETIPDLSVPDNLQKWYRLERAKRRVFYDLDLLGLRAGIVSGQFQPRLRFAFESNEPTAGANVHEIDLGQWVYTGHANGKITINLREADTVERERLRVDMGEAHRTLIGHFRHEMAHYFWQVLISGQRESACRAVFGDHNVPYQDALNRYYQNKPHLGWELEYVSAYASMHPWEDWAETFALYMDMVSSLETAHNFGFLPGPRSPFESFDPMVIEYQRLGIAMNEMNRTMGLIDLVPEVLARAVIEKMRFVDGLLRQVGDAPSEMVMRNVSSRGA